MLTSINVKKTYVPCLGFLARGFLVLSCLGHGFCAVRVVSASFFAFPLSLSLFSLCVLFRHFLMLFYIFSLLSPFFLDSNSCNCYRSSYFRQSRFFLCLKCLRSIPRCRCRLSIRCYVFAVCLTHDVGRGFALKTTRAILYLASTRFNQPECGFPSNFNFIFSLILVALHVASSGLVSFVIGRPNFSVFVWM